ncbi:hypothetical protein WS99_10760 [Burkholderia territorii]|nr:hypothetical protein WS51_00970 [Burkholderia territorii]KVL55305.1 hypothetical protein WS99_10760 [Burkholderia territorii]
MPGTIGTKLGVVRAEHEGGAGATFVHGDHPDMHACTCARTRHASFTAGRAAPAHHRMRGHRPVRISGDARRERASPAARQMLIATGPASGV